MNTAPKGTPVARNPLSGQKSPYLLQHADNPVDWRPWGREALAEAARLDRPILLSVGYAACHWCHVMAHESFEDDAIAALMNRLFVNVKVDREERPDIDHIYMSALHALGEQGGWPLTMFLGPDGQPFWGGTYFPPEPRWGRPSFGQVLQAVADAWASRAPLVTRNTAALGEALSQLARAQPGPGFAPDTVEAASRSLLRLTDPIRGGLRGAPRFPNPTIFRLFWQQSFRASPLAQALKDAVHGLLRGMSQGGIYDHLGGGYARYSTDAQWLAPHFEKMLYDNAQILELLAFAYADTGDPLYAARAHETVGWLLRDMTCDGAFAASEDADSEGEEGRFYVWTEAEIDQLLGTDAAAFKRAYDVTQAGNWEGHTILRREHPSGDEAAEARLAHARTILLQARDRRVRPGRDDKLLADWNGLMIAALARASAVFGQPHWLAAAVAAYAAVTTHLGTSDGRIDHAWREGVTTARGLLDDQACMARAALALYEATGQPRYLAQAERISRAALEWFADDDGSFFTTASDASDVPAARPRTGADNATPNGNGVMAEVLSRLYHSTGEPSWRDRADRVLRAFSGTDQPTGMPTLLAAASLLEDAVTLVVAGEADSPAGEKILSAALSNADPAVIVLRAAGAESLPTHHPAHGKTPAAGQQASLYVCRGGVCELPR